MDEQLAETARDLLIRLPASIEMPAGTGKTQTVAALAAIASEQRESTLILTHTHAGVDAIRKRLRAFGVPTKMTHVDTITGWAFDLVRSYPQLSGVVIPAEPDWTQSRAYVLGATRVMQSSAVQKVHEVSFKYLIIDEYQDCVVSQHAFIQSLQLAVPRTCLFGDRLQGIFRFGSEDLVSWNQALAESFPPVRLDHIPWRWSETNPALGAWLTAIRSELGQQRPLTIDTSIAGVSWRDVSTRQSTLASEASRMCGLGGSVLIIGKWANDCASYAAGVYGFGVMEELQGKFMAEFLGDLDRGERSTWAHRMARFGKECFVGFGNLDATVMTNLRRGNTVAHLRRPGLEAVLLALDAVIEDPCHSSLRAAMDALEAAPNTRLIRREAWNDIRSVLSVGADLRGESTLPHLARVRDQIRRSGRRASTRIVSRTLLVKGLEYDHVIIADGDGLSDCENLYVALTRARRTVTVYSRSPVLSF